MPEDAQDEAFVGQPRGVRVEAQDQRVEAAELAVLHVDGDCGRKTATAGLGGPGEDGDEVWVRVAETHGADFAFGGVAGEEALFDVDFGGGEMLG